MTPGPVTWPPHVQMLPWRRQLQDLGWVLGEEAGGAAGSADISNFAGQAAPKPSCSPPGVWEHPGSPFSPPTTFSCCPREPVGFFLPQPLPGFVEVEVWGWWGPRWTRSPAQGRSRDRSIPAADGTAGMALPRAGRSSLGRWWRTAGLTPPAQAALPSWGPSGSLSSHSAICTREEASEVTCALGRGWGKMREPAVPTQWLRRGL